MKTFEFEIKIIDKYKIITKMLWPLIQVNLPLMFYIIEIPISSQEYKKRLYDYFLPWYYGLSWSTTQRPCFLSRNITKNAETHPPPMRDVIIEQPQVTESRQIVHKSFAKPTCFKPTV